MSCIECNIRYMAENKLIVYTSKITKINIQKHFHFKALVFLKVVINLGYFVLFCFLGRRQCMFEKILHRFKGLAASSHINNNSSSTFLMSLFIQYIQEPKEFIIHACVALVFRKVFIQHCNHNSNDENNLNLSTQFPFNQNAYQKIILRCTYIYLYIFFNF